MTPRCLSACFIAGMLNFHTDSKVRQHLLSCNSQCFNRTQLQFNTQHLWTTLYKYSSSKIPNNNKDNSDRVKIDEKEDIKDGFGTQMEKTKLRIQVTKDKMKERVEHVRERMEEFVERENVVTIPNMLCVGRMVLSPFLGYLIINGSFDWALGLFVCAGVTDLLDGFIARNFKNQHSMLGSFLDPMADKLLVSVLVVTLTVAGMIPVALTSMIITRDVLLITAGFYIRYLSLPPPKTLGRYFDITHATAKLSPTLISKVNTLIQLSLVGFTLAAPVFSFVDHPYLQSLWYVTAASTVCSGLSYVFSKNTYKVLREVQGKKR